MDITCQAKKDETNLDRRGISLPLLKYPRSSESLLEYGSCQSGWHKGVELVEIGPGRGTLMDDMLRVCLEFIPLCAPSKLMYIVDNKKFQTNGVEHRSCVYG